MTHMKSTAEKLELIPIGRGKLILTKELQDQIDFLHDSIGNVEWIGVLCFKRLQGDLANPDRLVLEARHIYLMSVDTSGHTDADMGDSVIEIYESVPEMETMRMGLIHSHHTMDTFFSAEDVDELQINAPLHNYYLSLIVNKAGKYVAKVVFVGKTNVGNIFTDVDDNIVEVKAEKRVMYCIDMNIVKEERVRVSDLFKDRYNAVKEQSAAKYKARAEKFKEVSAGYQAKIWEDREPRVGYIGHYDPSQRPTTENDIQDLVKTWLNEGSEFSLSMEPEGLFNNISNGLNFYNKYFEKAGNEQLNQFGAYMQRLLFELSINLQPSAVVTVLRYYFTGSDSISKLLRAVVEDHPNFCSRMKREMVEEKLLKEDTFYGYDN